MMDAAEAERRTSNLEQLSAYFKAHEGEWLDAKDLEQFGGRQAWRTRVSDLRRLHHMHIDNRLQRDASNQVIKSEYRYLGHHPLGRDAAMPTTQKALF